MSIDQLPPQQIYILKLSMHLGEFEFFKLKPKGKWYGYFLFARTHYGG